MTLENEGTEPENLVKPKSVLTHANGDNQWDYGNGCRVSLRYRRHGVKNSYTDYHDVLFLTQGEKVQTAIKDLRALADRLEKKCIEDVL